MLCLLTDLPCTGLDIASLYHENYDRVQELVQCDERTDMYRDSMSSLDKQELLQVEITALDMEKSEEECVYLVSVNHVLKKVTVAFRGSVTAQDFIQDAKALVGEIPNPIEESQEQSSELCIHLGFREYLYGHKGITTDIFLPNLPRGNRDRERNDAADETTEKTKYETIMEHVKVHLSQHPNYRLYVTGHSLGGALATIFALEAAASKDEDISKPVTCITSGAPKVGNLDFLKAFEVLEETRKIRCLHIANFRDIVPLSPPIGALACGHAICCQRRRFRHVGFRLKLTPKTFIVSYPPKVRSYCGILVSISMTAKFLRLSTCLILVFLAFPRCLIFSRWSNIGFS